MNFQRLRELRKSLEVRNQAAEVGLEPGHLVLPLFAVSGRGVRQPIESLDGVFRLSADEMVKEVDELVRVGGTRVLLFGVMENADKTPTGEAAWDSQGPVPQAVRAIKARFPQVQIITDVCLCPYTDHGHCGVVRGAEVLNDETLPLLAQMALVHAEAGADIVAPSSMMDGQVSALREALGSGPGAPQILSYSVKFASRLYGPFRDAAGCTPSFGDRRTYQMDPRASSQILAEARADAAEGADALMVKPAHWYQDALWRVKEALPRLPLYAYQVSGEYMMIKLGARGGLFPFETAYLESLLALRRSGADFLLTYGTKEALGALKLLSDSF